MDRQPAVAGRFYPSDPLALRSYCRKHLVGEVKEPAFGLVAPHAGYMYSGHVAASVYSRVELPRDVIILCPNHTGRGSAVAVMSSGSWITPLGPVPINAELAEALKEESTLFEEDAIAHQQEHSLEVQLPFIQYLRPDVRLVPIDIGTNNLVLLREIGAALASVIAASQHPVLLIASSDMTHYEPADSARRKDSMAIREIERLDEDGLFAAVRDYGISMCGYAPTIAVMHACRRLGATSARLVRYANSGDVSGDYSSVVGYAGLIIQ